MIAERERMLSGETGGEGRYFSKSKAKISAINQELSKKQRAKETR